MTQKTLPVITEIGVGVGWALLTLLVVIIILSCNVNRLNVTDEDSDDDASHSPIYRTINHGNASEGVTFGVVPDLALVMNELPYTDSMISNKTLHLLSPSQQLRPNTLEDFLDYEEKQPKAVADFARKRRVIHFRDLGKSSPQGNVDDSPVPIQTHSL